MNQTFIVTKEHRRFTEFANAVRKERTIGICHGDAGVGKTNSARRYANWDTLEPYINEWGPRGDHDAKHYALANRARTVFYTPEVLCRPKDLMNDIDHWQAKVGICADEHLRSTETAPGSGPAGWRILSSYSSLTKPNGSRPLGSNCSATDTTANTSR